MAHQLFVLGLSHHSSPVELRERLAVPADALPAAVKRLTEVAGLDEALMVSTCNRVEIYGLADEGAAKRARTFLEETTGPGSLGAHVYERHGADAVRHAFRVASSLDSMVVGEPQILGQVKDAYAAATDAGVLGSLLDRCFTRAFAVAKRVRSETGIAAGAVSVSSIACDLALQIFGDLKGRRVLLVGAGKMGESAAKHLAKQGAKLFVLNRSHQRAQELAAACGGEPRSLSELSSELVLCDVAIASTSSDRFVITHELMKEVVRARKYRPLFLIDIAVPRNVDPRVGEMEGTFVYDVDDLSKVAQQNIALRKREADAAEKIVDGEVRAFEEWRRQQDLKPMIVGLREHVRSVLAAELERTLPKIKAATPEDRAALERMIDAATSKLVHAPLSALKAAGERGDPSVLEALRTLFPDAHARASGPQRPADGASPRTELDAVAPLVPTKKASGS
jgi:glutamyl-tRNA reductase